MYQPLYFDDLTRDLTLISNPLKPQTAPTMPRVFAPDADAPPLPPLPLPNIPSIMAPPSVEGSSMPRAEDGDANAVISAITESDRMNYRDVFPEDNVNIEGSSTHPPTSAASHSVPS